MTARGTGPVVLVSLGSAPPGEALLAGVAQLRTAGLPVHLISRVPPAPALAALLTSRVAAGRSRSRAGGRELRAGKLKVDPHRLPGAIGLQLNGRTRGLLADAVALVAVDAAALPAVWLAARRNRHAIAVNGLAAALTRLIPG
jgi:hypothetical protein